jgi:hypothetical protein
MAHTLSPIACDRCGDTFNRTSGRQVRCPECAAIVNRERNREHLRDRRDAAREAARPGLGELEFRSPVGPEEHKHAVAALGLHKVDEVIALANVNDPFYVGTGRDWRLARWFTALWQEAGFTDLAHLRRFHYWLVNTRRPDLENGLPYENRDEHFQELCKAGTKARILGLVDAERFTDRRNDPVIKNVIPRHDDPEPFAGLAENWQLKLRIPKVELPVLEFPEIGVGGYDYDDADQPVLLEVFIEKTTMDDILKPLCQGLHVNLSRARGFQSITAIIALLRRAEQFGKPAHVFYISDFDPGGDSMPRAFARQLQFWREKLEVEENVTLEVVVLTRKQVASYALPVIPIKDTDKRADNFTGKHGVDGAVELDALEGIHPGELARLVREAVEPWRDGTLESRLGDAADDAWEDASEAWQELSADLQRELDQIKAEADQVVQRHREAIDALNNELQPLRGRLKRFMKDAEDLSGDLDVDLPERPEAEEPDVDRPAFLFDSERGWLEQNEYWQAHKRGAA